jgi:hypothetical protein
MLRILERYGQDHARWQSALSTAGHGTLDAEGRAIRGARLTFNLEEILWIPPLTVVTGHGPGRTG